MNRKDLGQGIVFLSVLPFLYYVSALPGIFDLQSYIWVFVLLSLGYVLLPWLVTAPPERFRQGTAFFGAVYIGWIALSIVLYFVLGQTVSFLGGFVISTQVGLAGLVLLYLRTAPKA